MTSISPFLMSPPPALAASRARRQRSNAISRALESEAEWDFASATADTTSTSQTASSSSTPSLLPWRDDELICPLSPDPSRAHAGPHAPVHHAQADANANANAKAPFWAPVHVWPANEGELQAVLAQFAFPGPVSGRKHRRSGEIVVDHSCTSAGPPSGPAAPTPPPADSGKRRGTSGPTRRAWCAHCERGRSSA